MDPAIIFLGGLHFPSSKKLKATLDGAFKGEYKIIAPGIFSTKLVILALSPFILLIFVVIAILAVVWSTTVLRRSVIVTCIVVPVLVIVIVSLRFIFFRIILRTAKEFSSYHCALHRPSVICGYEIGAYVALTMKNQDIPLLLLSPIVKINGNLFFSSEEHKVDGERKVTIVYGEKSQSSQIQQAINSSNLTKPGKFRIEVIKDTDQYLRKLTCEDISIGNLLKI